MAFTYGKARSKIYREPNLCRSNFNIFGVNSKKLTIIYLFICHSFQTTTKTQKTTLKGNIKKLILLRKVTQKIRIKHTKALCIL